MMYMLGHILLLVSQGSCRFWDTCNYMLLYIPQHAATAMAGNPLKEDKPTDSSEAEACSADHESQPKQGSTSCFILCNTLT